MQHNGPCQWCWFGSRRPVGRRIVCVFPPNLADIAFDPYSGYSGYSAFLFITRSLQVFSICPVSGAAQGARLSALDVLWERWVPTRHWLPYWGSLDPATSELNFLLQPAWPSVFLISAPAALNTCCLSKVFIQVSKEFYEARVWLHLGASQQDVRGFRPYEASQQDRNRGQGQAPPPSPGAGAARAS